MNKLAFTFLLALLLGGVMAQVPVHNANAALDTNLLSIEFHPKGAPFSFPVADLKAVDNALILEFDHLGTELMDYVYTIEHCNQDWKRSQMFEQEYLMGFSEDRIQNITIAQNTRALYTHYYLGLPNRNMRWLLSGNYLLKVYDNTTERQLVLVRRFHVIEPLWGVSAQFVPPAQVDRINTHHEIDFSVKSKNIRIANPQNDMTAYILQNGRWDNAIGPLKPNIMREDQMVFDYQNKVVFPAGKEWRFFDMRSFDFKGENVKIIQQQFNHFEVTLLTDETRANRPYIFRKDNNGYFAIDNQNANQTLLQCEYAHVLFSVKQNLPFEEDDVYLFGAFTNWQIDPRFRMNYVPEAEVYALEIPLKQGYYNYQYLVVNHQTGAIDEEGLEGNSYQTRNTYQILLYYRPFGERYDRLLGFGGLDSTDRF
jgi:hypothetical protein